MPKLGFGRLWYHQNRFWGLGRPGKNPKIRGWEPRIWNRCRLLIRLGSGFSQSGLTEPNFGDFGIWSFGYRSIDIDGCQSISIDIGRYRSTSIDSDQVVIRVWSEFGQRWLKLIDLYQSTTRAQSDFSKSVQNRSKSRKNRSEILWLSSETLQKPRFTK